AKAPWMAALASPVIQARARSYSPLPARVCSVWNTPATPSMSVEIRIFMRMSPGLRRPQPGRLPFSARQPFAPLRRGFTDAGAAMAVAPADRFGVPQGRDDSLLGRLGRRLEQRVDAGFVQQRHGRHAALGQVGNGISR